MFEGRPKEFKAIKPNLALRNLLNRKKDDIKILETKIKLVNSVMKERSKEEILEGIWVQKGEKWTEFFNRLSEMFERCEKYAIAITRDFSYFPRLRKAMLKLKKKRINVKIMGMGSISKNNYLRAKWYHDHKVPIKVFETKIHPRILVIDGKEVFIRLDENPYKKRFTFHSLWSEDPSLVRVMDSYMKNLWNIAKPINFRKIKL